MNRFSITLTGRQMGLTTCTATFMLWSAMMNMSQCILLVAPSVHHATNLIERLYYAYDHLPLHLQVRMVTRNKKSLEFENGSRIIAGPVGGMPGRGLAISTLICIEGGYWPVKQGRDFWTNIRPVIASGAQSKVVMLSSGAYSGSLFHDIWTGAPQNGFKTLSVPWYMHPERDDAYMQVWRNGLGEERFKEEHECVFLPRQ